MREISPAVRQATLLVEGVTCGACAWLIENALQRAAGVRDVAVNVAARRIQIEWDDARTRLSEILRGIAALGYRTSGFDPAAAERGLAALVLTIVELLRQLMERQALRRVEDGTVSDEQAERLGTTLMRLDEAMNELTEKFGIERSELNIDLGPLGPLLGE